MLKTFKLNQRVLWIGFFALSLLGIYFSYHYFPKAIPILDLTITMNRAEALDDAQTLAKKFNLGPAVYDQAAVFLADTMAKHYIELEGGGKQVLTSVLQDDEISLYAWYVRHFKEHDINEVTILFTPQGKPYGFSEKVAETMPGPALSAQEAQILAEREAEQQWHINLNNYTLVEHAQKTQENGRVDHKFIYEHKYKQFDPQGHKKTNDAPFRLKLTVKGNKLTKVSRFLKIPEAFERRYAHMRSANNTLSLIAFALAFLLYILGGCFGGLIFLMRKHALLWRPSFIWAFALAFIGLFVAISSFPLTWMQYDTSLDKTTVIVKFIMTLIITFIAKLSILTVIFAVAESLTRRAFGNQFQLWKLWTMYGAASIQTIKRTIAGYLLVGIDIALVVVTYFFAMRTFNWWSPTETLINPNILSTYFPWITALGQSLDAGFIEECLFRAIPLSLGALIGEKRKNRTLWITLAFIVQIFIFGAAHANYPAQPYYARLIELIIPSTIFGLVYLSYGLLTTIIAHFVYDVFWFALPLFLTQAPGAPLNQALVIFGATIPLLVIIIARIYQGRFTSLDASYRNAAWQPSVATPLAKKVTDSESISTPRYNMHIITVITCISLVCLFFFSKKTFDTPSFSFPKETVKTIADSTLKQKGITLAAPWQQLISVETQLNSQQRFIWQKQPELYKKLLGTYLQTPQWKARYAQFEGDVAQRAEEYQLFINPDGSVARFFHQLPESAPGKTLTEQEARAIVAHFIKQQLGLNLADLTEISVESFKRPNRLDWVFTYSDPIAYTGEQGQARLAIQVSGDEITDYRKFIHIPEQWTRQDTQKQSTFNILVMVCSLVLTTLLGGALVASILQWMRYTFALNIGALFIVIIALKSLLSVLNGMPFILATFRTIEPFYHQLVAAGFGVFMSTTVQSLFFGILAGYMYHAYFRFNGAFSWRQSIMVSILCSTLLESINGILYYILPITKPLWPDITPAAAYMPWLTYALSAFTIYIISTIVFYIINKCFDYISYGWTRNYILTILISICIGIAIKGVTGIDALLPWIIPGIISGIALIVFYKYFIRYDRALVPLIMASSLILANSMVFIRNPYHGAQLGSLVASIIIIFFGYWWARLLKQ